MPFLLRVIFIFWFCQWDAFEPGAPVVEYFMAFVHEKMWYLVGRWWEYQAFIMSKSLLSKPLKKGYTNDFPQETWGILPSPCYPWNQWGLNRAVGRAKHGQIASGNETWLAGKLHCLFNPIHIYICIYIYMYIIYICMSVLIVFFHIHEAFSQPRPWWHWRSVEPLKP